MSVRYWLFIAALGVIFSAPLGAQEDIGERPSDPSAAEDQPASDPAIETDTAPLETPAELSGSAHDGEASGDGDQQEGQPPDIILGDGWAQWAMAATGFLALLISAWAVWLLKETLSATRAAVDQAEAGTKAAQEATKVTRSIGKAQLRAYLDIEVKEGTVAVDQPVRFETQIKNLGSTPAYSVSVTSAALIRKRDWWDWDYSLPEGEGPACRISPDEPRKVIVDIEGDPPIPKNTYDAIKSDRDCIFANVFVSYKDIFGDNHWVRFSFEFSGPDCFRTGRVRISQRGNDSSDE